MWSGGLGGSDGPTLPYRPIGRLGGGAVLLKKKKEKEKKKKHAEISYRINELWSGWLGDSLDWGEKRCFDKKKDCIARAYMLWFADSF